MDKIMLQAAAYVMYAERDKSHLSADARLESALAHVAKYTPADLIIRIWANNYCYTLEYKPDEYGQFVETLLI